MENSRRPYDRSLPKEPGPKKPRLAEGLNGPDRSSNGRSGFIQRPAASNSGGGGSSFQRDRDSESSDSVRGPFPHQPGQQLHQELVTQYKTALAELTFNSKPIITNLTIIAGENLHAAKAIADTVCANILEVPSEQKLPSLYLLDSIVKNIGRDYIKSFAARLPEVFCKVYRHVDPSIHQGMRHLFGTWKGVFPPQSLQMIEKDLGFTTTVNGSSPGTITSKPDSQSQRPAHSIHVNPKYLEARKHLQPTRARGPGSDISGALANSIEDVESLERTSSVNSGRSWTDTYAKHQHRDLVNEPARDRNTSVPYVDAEYGSNVSERSGFATGRVNETSKEQGFDKPCYESGSDVTGKLSTQKHGFDRGATHKSSNSNSHLQPKKNLTIRSTNGMSRNWKNSEEEEYIWDEMNSRPTDRSAAETLAQDHRTPDNYERLDIGSHLKRPQVVRDIGPRVDDKASADSISTELGKVTSGDQMPLSWPQELHPPEGKILGGPAKKLSGYSVGYTSGLGSSASIVVREPFQPQHGPSHNEASSYGPKVSMTQKPQNSGAGSSTAQSFMHPRPPSPAFSASNSNPQIRNISERNQPTIGAPTDPRKPPGLRNMGSHDQFSRDSLPLPSRDVYQTSIQRSQPQNLRTTSSVVPPLQQRKHVLSTQQRNLEVSEFDSSDGQNSFMPQISGTENLSSIVHSSSNKTNTRTENFPGSGQSITSSLLAAVVQSGILDRSSLTGSLTKPNLQVAGLGSSLGDLQPPLSSGPHPAIVSSSQTLHGNTGHLAFSQKKVEHPPLPPGPPPSSLVGVHPEQTLSAVKSTSDPVSSLLSSLVAKGLISSSKSDTTSLTSLMISDQPQDRGPGVASTSSMPVSSVPVLMTKPILSITDEPSSSAAEVSDDMPQSTTKIKNLIGFEFRPDVLRNLHPDLVRDLSDLPHQCSICGLRLKLQEQLDRHMEWHALRDSEQNPCNKTSRRWYTDSIDWVAGIGHFDPSDSATHEVSESSEQMVPADECQCACILCGELFEDFYSQERGEWMFKGAVYLTIPSSDSHDRTGTMSDNTFLSPIVHSNCISEDSVRDLGLACDIKMENDA